MHASWCVFLASLFLAPLGAVIADDAAPARPHDRPGLFGPHRSDPAYGLPRHAYSPFAGLDTPAPYVTAPGRDYREGGLLIKFAPDVAVPTGAGAGLAGRRAGAALTDRASLDGALAAQGVTSLERVFPNAAPAGARLAVTAGPGTPDLTRWFRARCAGATKSAVEALASEPGVAAVEPDYLRTLADERVPVDLVAPSPSVGEPGAVTAGPAQSGRVVRLMGGPPPSQIPNADSDPLLAQQWHLVASKVPEAWAYLEGQGRSPGGDRDIVVAVIDTGVDYNHPDLAANIWTNSREIAGNGRDDDGNGYVDDVHGVSTVGNSSSHSGNPMDDHGHGTHVAGIIAAQAGNHEGGVGVAYNVQILPIKAAQYSGVLAASDVAEAIQYAVQQGADIINMSFGGYARSQIEEDALAVAFGQCVLVAAAGNDGVPNEPCDSLIKPKPMYPAAYNWVLGVMARTANPDAKGNYLAGFSNFDGVPSTTVEYELMAPGADIWSTLPGAQYAAWDGTSMAAPVVSGLAALARTRWTDKDVYSSRFIMGQIATTGPSLQGRTDSAGKPVAFYQAADALAALTTVPQPQLSYLQHWLFDTVQQAANDDNDGIVDAGETVDLAIVIRNQWGKADQVTATLVAWAPNATQADPYVTWLTDTVDYGAIGSFNWDDNGLIYDAQQAVTGVRNPFRFVVAADCPNDHVIPLRLTMNCRNGLDAEDAATYTTQSRFVLLVQRGRELPRIISQDMTLTKDSLWLVPDRVLVESGVTLRVTEGTQIQFWSADPSSPYSANLRAMLQVEGRLLVEGSAAEPVEIFHGQAYPGYGVEFAMAGSGVADLRYASVVNPVLGSFYSPLRLLDHCFFLQNSPGGLRGTSSAAPSLQAALMSASRLRTSHGGLVLQLPMTNCLLDSCGALIYTLSARGNVFLKNANAEAVSSAVNAGYVFSATNAARPVAPEIHEGKTYLALSAMTGFDAAEAFAQQLGGHLVAINDAEENRFVRTYLQALPGRLAAYPALDLRWFSGDGIVGLTRQGPDGPFAWTSGEPVAYTNWASGAPSARWPAVSLWSGWGCGVQSWETGSWTEQTIVAGSSSRPFLIEVPGSWSQADLDAVSEEFLRRLPFGTFRDNAILNRWWDPDPAHWLRFRVDDTSWPSSWLRTRDTRLLIARNFWGTTSPVLIERAIWDYQDDFNLARYVWDPLLTEPPTDCYPFVVGVALSTDAGTNLSVVGAEPVTFTVRFNRDMDARIPPQVSFGPDTPLTDYTVHAINGGWQDPRTWTGTFNITPTTGDGYQLIRVAGAVAADDPWLVTGDDAGRFRFEIITSGTESMNLQATGGEGKVDLAWMQDDFELLAGYHLYRAARNTNDFVRLNATLIPAQTRSYRDQNVVPGEPYFYRFTVVKTDMAESDYSNVAQGTPLDTIAPVISHTPITSARPGLPLTLFADATDNVGIQGLTLFFRTLGGGGYTRRAMTWTAANRYAATIEGSHVASPGVEYYLEATDGVSVQRSGRADLPWQVRVDDRPVVTAVTPPVGPSTGGTAVTIAGANFAPGARVRFGETPADEVVVVSASQITCRAPAHYPATVDVTVTDAAGQSGSLLRAFAYQSDTVSLGLPATGGGQGSIVEVPVNAANVSGLGAAAFVVKFNGAVLKARGARTGSLTPGWNLAANTNTSGEVRVSMASPGGTTTGSGVLAQLEFEVLGAPGATTPLQLAEVLLNDGAIPVVTADGSFVVSAVYDVSGRVRYWNESRPVLGVQLALSGERLHAGTSGGDGSYLVAGAVAGSYVLTPTKADAASGITAYDGSLVLQHDARLIVLGSDAATAGDVDKSGGASSLDAFYILQQAVGLLPLPFPGAGAVWEFMPANRSYPNLAGNVTGQDFRALLLGDVSGNWPAAGGGLVGLQGPGPGGDEVVLALRQKPTSADGEMPFWLVAKSAPARIYALDLVIEYDGAGAEAVRLGALAEGMSLAANSSEAGRVRVALAGAVPVGGIGSLLTFSLPSVPPARDVHIRSAIVNEGSVAVRIDEVGAEFDQDEDKDGLSDWEEVVAGTDPMRKESVLGWHGVVLEEPSRLVLRWAAVPGRAYQIQCRTRLDEGEWQNLGQSVLADQTIMSGADETVNQQPTRFYRVRLAD